MRAFITSSAFWLALPSSTCVAELSGPTPDHGDGSHSPLEAARTMTLASSNGSQLSVQVNLAAMTNVQYDVTTNPGSNAIQMQIQHADPVRETTNNLMEGSSFDVATDGVIDRFQITYRGGRSGHEVGVTAQISSAPPVLQHSIMESTNKNNVASWPLVFSWKPAALTGTNCLAFPLSNAPPLLSFQLTD